MRMRTWKSRKPSIPAATRFEAVPFLFFNPLKDIYMKQLVIAITAAATFALATPVFANEGGSCHFHGNKPAAETTVAECAMQRKMIWVKDGRLDASWKDLKQEKVELVDGKKGKEWKVTFRNPAAKDKTKDTIYVFMSQPGNFIAANHTGN